MSPPSDLTSMEDDGSIVATTSTNVSALDPVTGPMERLLRRFLDTRTAELARIDPALERVGAEVRELVLGGGKRLRPAFVYWGHRASGHGHDDAVLTLAAAVELLHNFALIHDDVMDRSARRRGRPALHKALTDVHREGNLAGDPSWFGVGAAILAGDLAFVWADQLFDEAALPAEALARARAVFTTLRVEVTAGQYLDLRLAGNPAAGEEDALRVALLKSGRYTVTRPLQLGAAVGGGVDPVLDEALRVFGDTIGVAFQLRDDILGLFGDPQATGKGALSDLREGKRTLLVIRALKLADPSERAELERMLGDPDVDAGGADRARQIVVESGALQAIEELVRDRQEQARRALGPVPQPARGALEQLADVALHRSG